MRKLTITKIVASILSVVTPLLAAVADPVEANRLTKSSLIYYAVASSPNQKVFRSTVGGQSVRQVFESTNILGLTAPVTSDLLYVVNESGDIVFVDPSINASKTLTSSMFVQGGIAQSRYQASIFFIGGSEQGVYQISTFEEGTPRLLALLPPFYVGGYVSANSPVKVYWTENGVFDGTSRIRSINVSGVGADARTVYSQTDADVGGRPIGPITEGSLTLYYCLQGDVSSEVMALTEGTSSPTTVTTVSGRCTGLAYQSRRDYLIVSTRVLDNTGRIVAFDLSKKSAAEEIFVDSPVIGVSVADVLYFERTDPVVAPIIKITSNNVNFSFVSYTSKSSVNASKTAATYSYELALTGPRKKKNKVVTTSKTNYTFKKLKKGAYSFKYRVVQKTGRTVVKSKYSALVNFTIN